MNVVLVTGASSGIGRAFAIRAARAGYGVVAIGRDAAALDAVAERARAEHGRIITATYDIGDPANARSIVDLAGAEFGRIDVLVNNAGQVAVGPLAEQSDDALRAQFGTHVIGPIALVREALPLLRASRGIVFMVGSGVARIPVGGLGAYAPSKAATRSATTILRRELKRDGIAVTYVDPGVVDTAFMTRAGMAGAPAALLASPDDVARKMLVAIAGRPRVLNAVPWQTAFVALATLFPAVTEYVLERTPALVGVQPVTPAQPAIAPAEPAMLPAVSEEHAVPDVVSSAEEVEAERTMPVPLSPFDEALGPVRRRMERVRLTAAFVRGVLQRDAILDPGEVALRWAGMPNKNERAATIEVLEALLAAGYLERNGDHYRVVRIPG